MIAVTVTFEIKEECLQEFMRLVIANAFTSKMVEEGCHQFDVCTKGDAPNEVFLYELYEDAAAFDLHLMSAHFKSFDQAVAHMIEEKHVQVFGEVHQ